MKQENVSIIIVSWNVKDDVLACLGSIQSCLEGLSPEVIVVDNGSGDGTSEAIKKQYPWVRLIENKGNVGFAKANNQGIKLSRGDYLLFLNPDTLIDLTTLENLIRLLKNYHDAGFIGPKILNPDKTHQPSVRKFPTMVSQLLILLKLHRLFPNLKTVRSYFQLDFDPSFEQTVEQIMGACFMTKRSVLNKIGLFDESFYLWFEEIDLQKRAVAAGFKNYYTPQAQIIHKKGESFNKLKALSKQRILNRSMIHYFSKHGARKDVVLLRLFAPLSLLLACAVQILEWSHLLPERGKNF